MNYLKTLSIVLLAATLLPSGAALAREDRPAQDAAPGQGPVFHLFGPQSVFNKLDNAVPVQNQPAQGQSAAAVNAADSAAAASAPATNAAATSDNGNGGAGGLLHSMFVTGDGTPANARLSQGRPGAR